MSKQKRLFIDMCAGSELKDTQGETLSIEGADISELEAGKGRFNDNHGKGFFNTLGRVTGAKKIFKYEDCENERHKYYWEKIKAPYIYVAGELYNDDDHPNARAAAAILRNIHREDAPLRMKASVEGGVLSRGIKDPTRLARTKIHSVALTFTPANNATLVEPLNIDKSNTDWEADKQLIKSVMHLAETNVPSFRHIERHASANTIYENINKIQELAKSIGVEIEIKDTDPETIMQKAVLNKLATNISKINNMVKGFKNTYNYMKLAPAQTSSAAVSPAKPKLEPVKAQVADEQKREAQRTAQDAYQQDIGKLKSDPTTPMKPKDTSSPAGTMKVQSADKVKNTNILKGYASKIMQDPSHANTIINSLKERGLSDDKIKHVMGKIKSHMQEPVKKSADEVEKGDIARALKGLAVASTMAVGANSMSPKDRPKKVPESKERSVATKDKQKVARDPDLQINAKKMGYDERQPNAKKKWREKFKDKLKKSLLSDETLKKTKLYHGADTPFKVKDGSIKKALTAGYGGAGVPTSVTGGAVFQTESLEDGRKKTKKSEDSDEFKYINCDNCGHEQVYMKHQVKCRKCRQYFNLSKLENLF